MNHHAEVEIQVTVQIQLQPLYPLNFNYPTDWLCWKRQFEQLRVASGLQDKALRSNWVPSSTAWERKTKQYSPLPMQHKKCKRYTTLCIRSKHLTLFEGVKECHFRDGPVHQTQTWIQAWYIQKHHPETYITYPLWPPQVDPERARRRSSQKWKSQHHGAWEWSLSTKRVVQESASIRCVFWEVCLSPAKGQQHSSQQTTAKSFTKFNRFWQIHTLLTTMYG